MQYKLKKIYKFDEMSFAEKLDYEEEIDSIIPKKITEEVIIKIFLFSKAIEWNSGNSIFVKKIKFILGDSWSLFIFLNICQSFESFNFKKDKSKNDFYIKNSYIGSQTIFWKSVEFLSNFLITIGVEICQNIKTKIATLTHISIKLLIELNVINEKKNYIKTIKNFGEEYYNKTCINYKMNIEIFFERKFNVENKFHRHPLKIIEYKYPIKIGEKIIISEKSIITGPTYIRAEIYDKSNPYGIDAFKIKNKSLKDIYTKTKFYPDVVFINHIKKKFFFKLDIKSIEKEIELVKDEFERTFDELNWSDETIKKRSGIQKKYSRLLEDKKIYNFLNHNWDEYYYLSSNNDYRGRKYYCSPLTFTHFKLSRYCFHYGYDGFFSEPFFDWDSYKSFFEEIYEKYETNFEKKINEVVGFYLIGIGKIDEERKKKVETPVEDILKKGKNIFLGKEKIEIKEEWFNWSLKEKIDIIELELYIFSLDLLLKGDRTKRIIIKDATASGYQIQMCLTGSKDHSKLGCINIGEKNIFTDTYMFIVESFKKTLNDNKLPDWSEKYFKRSIIKKFCMIIPYSAGFEECFLNIETIVLEEDYKKCKIIFSMFYDFIKKDLWEIMGQEKSFKEYIKNHLHEKGNYLVESETARANLQYNKAIIKEYDTKYINLEKKKKRTTRLYYRESDRLDKKQTLTGFSPNFTHFHDGDIIRILHLEPYNLEFASIHDAFIISCFECGKLVHSYGNIFKIKIRFKHKIPITCIM